MKGIKIWLLSLVVIITMAGCADLGLAKALELDAPVNLSEKLQMMSSIPVKTIHVKLIIMGQSHYMELPNGCTINEALEAIAEVKHGVVCCDNRDVQCINGLCQDPYKNEWWVIKVNGNSQNYSSHSRLSPGDVVELVWTGKIEHRRLQEWLLSFSKGK